MSLDFSHLATISIVVFVVWLAVAGALVIEHEHRHGWREWKRYVAGTATICVGCLLVGIIFDNALLAIVPTILATAGVPIIYLHEHEEPSAAHARRNTKRTKLWELTTDLREKGRRESDMDEAGRQN